MSWWSEASGKRKAGYVFLFVMIFSGVLGAVNPVEPETVTEYETVELFSEDFKAGVWWVSGDYPVITVPEGATDIIMSLDWEGGSRNTNIKLYLWESGETKDKSLGYINSQRVKQGSESISKDIGEVKDFFVEVTILQNCEGVFKLSAVVPT